MRIVYNTRNCLCRERRFIGQLVPLLHIRKVIPYRTDSLVCQRLGERFHKAVQHARAGTVAQHQKGDHVRWGDDPHRNRTGTG
jgi:hypothetical protein